MGYRTTLAALVFLALAGCSATKPPTEAKAAAAPAAPVRVARAEIRTVPVEVAAIGNVEASTTVAIKPLVGGTLTKVYIEDGQNVREGDRLFDIYDKPYLEAIRQIEANIARDTALLRQAEASLARAQAQEAHYGKQADRYEKLAGEGIFSREIADQAAVEARARRTAVRAETAAIESAQAAIRASEASLATAKLNLSYCYLRSPISGRAGAVLVKAGNVVKAAEQTLVDIQKMQPVYVSFSVPEEHLAQVRQRIASGLGVQAAIPNEPSTFTGKLDFIDNSVDATTGTIRLRGTFANLDARLWPGQFVNVKVRLEERPQTVVVPAAAIQTGQQGNFVYVVKPDSTVDLRVVTPGPRIDSGTAILNGLAGNETVVIEGHLRLAPGAKVKAS